MERNKKGQFTSAGIKKQWKDGSFRNKMSKRWIGEKNPLFKNAKKTTNCLICNKVFSYYESNHTKGEYCSIKCSSLSKKRSKNISESLKGKKLTDEHKKKLSEVHFGLQVGENNGSWKGGIYNIVLLIRKSIRYNNWRNEIFKRDSYSCQKCFTSKDIKAHHIKAFSRIIKDNNIKSFNDAINCLELWDIKNGITYCDCCHKQKHKELRNEN